MPWVRVVVSALGVLLAYYAMPVAWSDRAVVPLLQTIVGIALLGWAIWGQVRRQLSGSADVDLPTLLTLLLLVMAVFAWGYFALEQSRPGQMADLATRTDSLYFTLQVLTTVGLGDVHAVGQTARALVIGQMVFDLVFVAAAGSVLVSAIRTRLSNPQEES